MQLEDWLDDLCVRFIINLPAEELVSVERICFQVEEAQWFYEDFIRPLDPSLPSLSLKAFSLRIFQHCPLFSTWSMQDYTSAFAEFLAYKQRVPVRGAIMLNEDMDEVVLVKGWKKGANWSFPRGKINKDENDLDCAVREVYEETGYDIQAAGLVKAEKDMKYIEVTMREQHMKLYVFRGVPKTTHFEPRTRKEISKIEWYKLTDLPTLKKKHAPHDPHDESAALNANKFYMVAPFLHPLKKWIAQQKKKKKENRYSSSHLSAPPMLFEESATEGEPGPVTFTDHQPELWSPAVPSSLPELATAQQQPPPQDPSSHLKELLKIGSAPTESGDHVRPPQVPIKDLAKSNALLSLLRSGSTAEMGANSRTPFEYDTFKASESEPNQRLMSRPGLSTSVSGIPAPSQSVSQPQLPNQQRSLLELFSSASRPEASDSSVLEASPGVANTAPTKSAQPPLAPYHRTGDPDFANTSPEDRRAQLIPPANALPKLTHHTRTLLDAFKTAPLKATPIQQPVSQATQPSIAPDRKALLNFFKPPSLMIQPEPSARDRSSALHQFRPPADEAIHPSAQASQTVTKQHPASSNASTLLGLFGNSKNAAMKPIAQLEEPPQAPAELAAGPISSPKPQSLQPQIELLSLLRRDARKKSLQAPRAGETAATVDGPLNQPHFESIVKSPPQISSGNLRRSPVPAHRTLFDPKQPTPTKILQRPEESKRVQSKSPGQTKAKTAAASPKQKSRPQQEKTFQPQILKRPQKWEDRDSITPSPTIIASPDDMQKPTSPIANVFATSPKSDMTPINASPNLAESGRRPSQQSENQKQNLLSLLTGAGGSFGVSKPRQISTPGAVSPLSQSMVVSPSLEDAPISTRSRMSSLASVSAVGAPTEGRPKVEKRQTAAGDKAFLLGYLGRIASQEGQPAE